jgi:glycosyltransferase involved in cell wall biosynthesis
MYKGLSISAVIPCYNEEHGITAVLSRIPACVDEVVVVDNNSTDKTASVAKKQGAVVVHESRQGYGAAVLKGLQSATKDILVVLDGDGTYGPEYIEPMAAMLQKHNCDFVSANRFSVGNTNSMPRLNALGNRILTFFTKLFFLVNIEDSQSGMFMLRKSVLPALRLRSQGMSFSEEIKLAVLTDPALSFREYPIVYHANSRLGQKKLNLWHDGFYNLYFLLRKRISR